MISRLGPFHTIVSFIGPFRFIMDGSGLKEVLYECYTTLAEDKMLEGHALGSIFRDDHHNKEIYTG